MLVIKFSCINQRLRRITSGIIPSNAYGKLKFEFDFRTTDWDMAETKIANFYYNGENYRIELDKHNQCFVPQEVIYKPSFKVSVHGGDIVTNSIGVRVDDMDAGPGNTPSSPGNLGAIFVPSIDENKILSWTISDGKDMKLPDPVDLNPFDEWTEDGDVVSEYEWEEDV